jgi:cytochrome d ubiquinol oxidase subunit I
MAIAAVLLWRNRLQQSRGMLWVLMLCAPFPYIATTAGWWTAELAQLPQRCKKIEELENIFGGW